MNRIRNYYDNLTLARKIRLAFLIIQIPMTVMLVICTYNLWSINNTYEELIESAVVASGFSLDFKKDLDDETYLVIAGNKSYEESDLDELLLEARQVVQNLESLSSDETNLKRLKSAHRYLQNLGTYLSRIEQNIEDGDKYEENMLIWENDVQIVSSLVQETMSEYIYFEVKAFQALREYYQSFYMTLINVFSLIIILLLILTGILSVIIPKNISKPIEEKVVEEQTRLRKAELELLQAQINPHFLYNTLDTIVWAAEDSDQKTVVSMVKSLSDFFRTSLNQGKEIVTIGEEILHAKSYLEIQHVRYRDILEYSIDIDDEIKGCLIPKITIQPLIENALYHGIKNKRGMGKISVRGFVENGICIIEVADNGKGMTEQRLGQVRERIEDYKNRIGGEIFGLSNVNERIQLKFGKEYGIHVDSVLDEGTTIRVYLPMVDES